MRFKPFAYDNWYYLPAKHNPDRDIYCWTHCQGEFSPEYENSFQEHLAKYPMLNKYYAKLNGKRIRAVLDDEPLFLGSRGLEELIYTH